jgi:hypothetical protein
MLNVRPLVLAGALLLPAVVVAQTAPASTPPPAPAAPATTTTTAKKTMPPMPEKLPPPTWNAGTVETVKGKLIGVWRSKRFGVVVGLDTGKEDVVLLDVGPAYFIDPKITFAAEDQIEARGSRVTFTNHMPGMLVIWLKRGPTTINIRNDTGKSLW